MLQGAPKSTRNPGERERHTATTEKQTKEVEVMQSCYGLMVLIRDSALSENLNVVLLPGDLISL